MISAAGQTGGEHCDTPAEVAAIQKQAAELIHMSGTDFYYESMVTLAERLSKIAPMPGPHKIYYGNSGTEAIEGAIMRSCARSTQSRLIVGNAPSWTSVTRATRVVLPTAARLSGCEEPGDETGGISDRGSHDGHQFLRRRQRSLGGLHDVRHGVED